MTISSINGTNTQVRQIGMNQTTDSYSRNIQNQIANAQKQLQELSSNEDMSLEEKMKRRQEIQQQINDLNVQLRQYQIEKRREKQQAASIDDMLGSTGNTKGGSKSTNCLQASMTAIISADSSIKQAEIQGSVATSMKGKAAVLKAEIKNDHGGNIEKKQEQLADIEQKAQAAVSSQLSTLAEANKTIEESAEADNKDTKTTNAKEKDSEENVSGADTQKETVSDKKGISVLESSSADKDTVTPQPTVYKSVDIHL